MHGCLPAKLASRHYEMLDRLKSLEHRLREQDEPEGVALSVTERAEPADDYRALVDEYFRRLSEAGTAAPQ